LSEIDQFAERHGFTRSGFLVSAAKRAMNENAPAKKRQTTGRR
jgi:hypothetical protein